MLKVGLTGGIGSGKSVVAEVFALLHIPVFNADLEAKKIMNESKELKEELLNEFGANTYLEGKLNRPYLAAQVFDNPYKLEKLNALVHPATIAAAENWMALQNAPYVIKEAALLFESGSSAQLDYIIGVFAPLPLRLQRVMERDKLSAEQIKSRMERQIDDLIKMRLCDFKLMNDEQSLLIPQVLELHQKLLNLSSQ